MSTRTWSRRRRAGAGGVDGPRGTRSLLRGGWAPSGRATPVVVLAGTGPFDPSRTRPSPSLCVHGSRDVTSGTGRLGAGPVVIESLGAEDVARHRARLAELLRDAVDSGAPVGSLPLRAAAEGAPYGP